MIRKFNEIITNGLFFIGKDFIKLMMRTFILLFCTTLFSLTPNNVISQNSKIKIDVDKTITVDEVFVLITKQTDYNFVYENGLFKDFPKIQVKKGSIRTLKLLQESLSGGNLTIIVSTNNNIIIKENTRSNRNLQKKVTGKVTDEKGIPVPGVTVLVKGINKGTATDFNGNYTIIVPDPANVLVFSYLGFESTEIMVGNQNIIDVTLKESVNQLKEITINAGYYNTTQRKATGSIAKISAKTIEKQPVNNPLAAMQGHMAGVNIRQTTGVPGGGFEIDIRGQNFINGTTQPLFIIDGVPYGSESLELGAFRKEDGNSVAVGASINSGNVSPLNAISPTDIASIEVLKDADATAIYGARGANGVVLITTKKGTAGKTKLVVNMSSTLGRVSRFMGLLNTQQYLELRREGLINSGNGDRIGNPNFNSFIPELNVWDKNRYTDWQKELIGGTAFRNNAQLSLSGGNKQTQFLISGSYQKETTVFPGDANYKKGTLRSNINHQSNNQLFKINFSTSYTMEDNQLPLSDFTRQAYTLIPNAPALYDDAGNLNWEDNTFDNPLALLEREYRSKTNMLLVNTMLSYQLLPSLALKTNLGYTKYQLSSNATIPNTSYNPSSSFGMSSSTSALNTNNSINESWIVEPQLNWQKNWGEVSLSVLIGSTFQKQNTQQFFQVGTGFSSNILIHNLAAAETIEVFQDVNSEYKYQAFFGRLNLNWKDKYILNLTGRRDGSSRFGPSRKFGNFGALGVAWLFTEEEFLANSNLLSSGKLRGSYGTTGSDNIGDYKYFDTYNVAGVDYNGVRALVPTGVFDPNYAWQENKKLELALELGFLNNNILLNSSWYQNRSSNQLGARPLATTTGFNGLTGNFDATVENTGIEIDLHTKNIQNKNFNWKTTFNLSIPRNKLVKYDGLENSADVNRYRIGKPLTEIPLYHALGVNPETGFYEFEDYNNDGIINSNDKQWFEDLAPKFYGGLGNILTYKSLSLEIFFQFKKQKDRNYLNVTSTAGLNRNARVDLYNRWQEAGDIASIQKAGFNNPNQNESSSAISDASFVRLRNISLNYKVPKTVNLGIDINLYVQGQNLLTITNFKGRGADPEQSGSSTLPPLQQITLGVQLGF